MASVVTSTTKPTRIGWFAEPRSNIPVGFRPCHVVQHIERLHKHSAECTGLPRERDLTRPRSATPSRESGPRRCA